MTLNEHWTTSGGIADVAVRTQFGGRTMQHRQPIFCTLSPQEASIALAMGDDPDTAAGMSIPHPGLAYRARCGISSEEHSGFLKPFAGRVICASFQHKGECHLPFHLGVHCLEPTYINSCHSVTATTHKHGPLPRQYQVRPARRHHPPSHAPYLRPARARHTACIHRSLPDRGRSRADTLGPEIGEMRIESMQGLTLDVDLANNQSCSCTAKAPRVLLCWHYLALHVQDTLPATSAIARRAGRVQLVWATQPDLDLESERVDAHQKGIQGAFRPQPTALLPATWDCVLDQRQHA